MAKEKKETVTVKKETQVGVSVPNFEKRLVAVEKAIANMRAKGYQI